MPEAYCPRCQRVRPMKVPWVGYHVLRVVFIPIALVMIALSPILMSEILFLLPVFCVFSLGLVFVWNEARRPPSCLTCLLELDDPT